MVLGEIVYVVLYGGRAHMTKASPAPYVASPTPLPSTRLGAMSEEKGRVLG